MFSETENRKRSNILVVDDVVENLRVLSGMLKEQGHEVRPVLSGQLALQAARTYPPDLILLDINMPQMNGYEVCRELKLDPNLSKIPVIFISALTEVKDKVRGFQAGGADYIVKPFQLEEVSARVTTHLNLNRMMSDLEALVQEKILEISESQMATIFALAKLSESRDDITGHHIERVALFSRIIAEKLRVDENYKNRLSSQDIDLIENASSLHDIGKVGVPDGILLKPGKLTDDEYERIKIHTTIGSQTLRTVSSRYPKNDFIKVGIEIAQSHHEKWDGTGYPEHLSQYQIPLSARIVAIADVYDALRSDRPYKKGLSHVECCKIITDSSGSHFDPGIVNAFHESSSLFLANTKHMDE